MIHPFLILTPEGRVSGQYFWAHPALLALGELAGLPQLLSAVEVAITIGMTSMLSEEWVNERRAGLITCALAAGSPLLVLTAGTLHNSNLAVACSATTAWALLRLSRARDTRASVLLGIATGLALHNRVLDHAVITATAGSIWLVAMRRSSADFPTFVRESARRLAWALVIVGFALGVLGLTNSAVSGSPFHSGYWVFNDGHGWTTFGFGMGPFDFPHTPAIALTKSVAYLTHLAVWAAGSPLLPLLCLVALVRRRPRRSDLAPALVVLAYFVAYFFYSGFQMLGTGPVYFLALLPVLLAWAGNLLADWDDVHAGVEPSGRWGPTLVVSVMLGSLALFWPTRIVEARRMARASSACEDLVARHGVHHAFVLVERASADVARGRVEGMTWAFRPPFPRPSYDDDVLFGAVRPIDRERQNAFAAASKRELLYAQCLQTDTPRLFRLDPKGVTQPY